MEFVLGLICELVVTLALEVFLACLSGLLTRWFVTQTVDISKDGPIADSDDYLKNAWVTFAILNGVVFIIIAVGIIAFLFFSGAFSARPEA